MYVKEDSETDFSLLRKICLSLLHVHRMQKNINIKRKYNINI